MFLPTIGTVNQHQFLTYSLFKMDMAMSQAATRAFASMFLGPIVLPVNAYMVLEVSRENLVADALRELVEMTTNDLKKPLKVSNSTY